MDARLTLKLKITQTSLSMFLQLDRIQFLSAFIAISVDHPLSKKFEKNDFINFKKNVIKPEQLKALADAENWDTILVFLTHPFIKRIPIFLQILF